jgi:hypothetical protein
MRAIHQFKSEALRIGIVAVILAAVFIIQGCSTNPRAPRLRPVSLFIIPAGQALPLKIPVWVGPARNPPLKETVGQDYRLRREGVDDLLEQLRSNKRAEFIKVILKPDGGMVVNRSDDHIWYTWLTAMHADHLLVIADLPLSYGGKDKGGVAVPLDSRLWRQLRRDDAVRVEIREDGVNLLDIPGR